MKNISTGAGLAILGLGIAVHPLLSGLGSSATASASTTPAAASLASAASAQAGPTVVWMGVSQNWDWTRAALFRMWSDGRTEARMIAVNYDVGENAIVGFTASDWAEVPPPPGGDGFACRTDINGDRKVDGSDLSFLLNAWGQDGGCEPEATYPCLDLGNLADGVAVK
jgi:hypothetical protein